MDPITAAIVGALAAGALRGLTKIGENGTLRCLHLSQGHTQQEIRSQKRCHASSCPTGKQT